MKIILNAPTDVVVVAEQKKTISELNINQMIDNPQTKTIAVNTVELGRIVLWQDADYDTIGQWTDTDVENKIKALYP